MLTFEIVRVKSNVKYSTDEKRALRPNKQVRETFENSACRRLRLVA